MNYLTKSTESDTVFFPCSVFPGVQIQGGSTRGLGIPAPKPLSKKVPIGGFQANLAGSRAPHNKIYLFNSNEECDSLVHRLAVGVSPTPTDRMVFPLWNTVRFGPF